MKKIGWFLILSLVIVLAGCGAVTEINGLTTIAQSSSRFPDNPNQNLTFAEENLD